MILFSARGAYLLLLPLGRAPIRNGALIYILRNIRMSKTKFVYLFEKDRENWRTGLLSLDPFWLKTTSQAIAEKIWDEGFRGICALT